MRPVYSRPTRGNPRHLQAIMFAKDYSKNFRQKLRREHQESYQLKRKSSKRVIPNPYQFWHNTVQHRTSAKGRAHLKAISRITDQGIEGTKTPQRSTTASFLETAFSCATSRLQVHSICKQRYLEGPIQHAGFTWYILLVGGLSCSPFLAVTPQATHPYFRRM